MGRYLIGLVLFLSFAGTACTPLKTALSSNSSADSTPTQAAPPPTGDTPPTGVLGPGLVGNCGMQTNAQPVAYCETFDNPHPITGRTGQMDNTLWGVSRGGGVANLGQPIGWAATNIDVCGTVQSGVVLENDIQICNGQLRESSNDNISGGFEAGTVTALTMYPKQKFDFTGRTGTVAFDVTNDSAGTHATWPEFWITDLPVPNPFAHFGTFQSLPQNGLAVRFAAACPPGQFCDCPTTDTQYRFTVDSAAIMRDWVMEDNTTEGSSLCEAVASAPSCVQTGMTVTVLDCVREPDPSLGPNGGKNHIELSVSQNQVDVYATDAGTTAPLKHIAVIKKANLTFTRGFIWMEDVHYNADKGDPNRPSQKSHTFAWDNIAFDGPILQRDISLDVVDSLVPTPGGVYLGWTAVPPTPITLTTLPMTEGNISAASGAYLLFNFWYEATPTQFTYTINGHVNTAPWPFPDTLAFTQRTIALPVPLNQLISGPNKVTIVSDQAMEVYNVNINLQNAAGIVFPPSH